MFKPICDYTETSIECARYSESQIETMMFGGFMRSKKFILISEDDKPEGCGLFLRPQAKIKPYRLDFLIKGVGFKSAKRIWPPNSIKYLCVECDGKEFHQSKEDKERDAIRDEYLSKRGVKTLRYTGSEIYKNSYEIALGVANHLEGMIYDG